MSFMENVSLLDLTIRSSIEVILFDALTDKPIDYGSGSICTYRDKQYFITVAHVTSFKDRKVYARIPTRGKTKEDQAPFYSTGALWYFKRFNLEERNINVDESEELDIAFCEIEPDIQFYQQEVNIGDYSLKECEKLKLNLNRAEMPDKEDEHFSFSGHVNHKIFEDKYIHSELQVECGMEYKSKTEDFLLFNTIDEIKKETNYAGTSGAPIIANSGKLVGFVSSVNKGTPMIFAFSVARCKELIDYLIMHHNT